MKGWNTCYARVNSLINIATYKLFDEAERVYVKVTSLIGNTTYNYCDGIRVSSSYLPYI